MKKREIQDWVAALAIRIEALERIVGRDTPVGNPVSGKDLADKMMTAKQRADESCDPIVHIGLTPQNFADLDVYFHDFLGVNHVSPDSRLFGLNLVPANEAYIQTDDELHSKRTLL